MTARWAGFTAPFRWLIDAVDVGRHQPGVVISAVATAVLIGFLPSLPQQAMAIAGAPAGIGLMMVFQVVAIGMALLVMPVLRGGVYRIIDGAERGQPVALGQIFDGFRDGSYGRFVLVTLLSMAAFLVLMVVMVITLAVVAGAEALQGVQAWMEQLVALQSQVEAGKTIQPNDLPPPPVGIGAMAAVLLAFLPLWLFVGLGTAWGLIGVALRGDSPVAALVQGLRAALLHAAPILVMAMVLVLPAGLLMGLIGLLLGGMVALFSLISPALGAALGLVLMLGLGIVFATIGYGFLLGGWRATCGDGAPVASDPVATGGFEA